MSAEKAPLTGPHNKVIQYMEKEDDSIVVVDYDVSLSRAKRRVLRPYRYILKFLGWIPFHKKFCHFGGVWIIRILWILIIIAAFLFQIITCFQRDQFTLGQYKNITINGDTHPRVAIECSDNISSKFILRDLLLLASYVFGIYFFFRDEHDEYLPQLTEKVFFKHKELSQNECDRSNRKLVRKLVWQCVLGLVWIVCSFTIRVMTSKSIRLWDANTIIYWSDDVIISGPSKIIMLILALFGFVMFDLVYITALMNYAAQSELIISFIEVVHTCILQKKYIDTSETTTDHEERTANTKEKPVAKVKSGFDEALKDVMDCRRKINILNGKTSTAAALVLFNVASNAIIAIVYLHSENQAEADRISVHMEALTAVTARLNVISWVVLVFFPFIQAARVTSKCQQLAATGLEIRSRTLAAYSTTNQIDLDSYVNTIQTLKMAATIFGVPIYPWLLWGTVAILSFTALVLFQTDVYNFFYF